MAEAVDAAPEGPAGRGKGKGLMVGLALAALLGGGGFYATRAGLVDPAALLGGGGHEAPAAEVAFVALEPIMTTLPPGASARALRFTGQLEVDPAHAAEVAALTPRVLDTLGTYLRAVDVADLENPAAVQRLRAQMLRRVQVVTGEGRVRDLLVTEFILN
jgi:flagellar FliL protein